MLADPNIQKRLEDTKAAGEVKALNEFFDMLQNQPNRAYYGIQHVLKANEAQAIQTLLVTDDLFRSANIQQRKQYVALVESVKEHGGDVKIFSTMHVSGERKFLKMFTDSKRVGKTFWSCCDFEIPNA